MKIIEDSRLGTMTIEKYYPNCTAIFIVAKNIVMYMKNGKLHNELGAAYYSTWATQHFLDGTGLEDNPPLSRKKHKALLEELRNSTDYQKIS
jgi:hypothetical protein